MATPPPPPLPFWFRIWGSAHSHLSPFQFGSFQKTEIWNSFTGKCFSPTWSFANTSLEDKRLVWEKQSFRQNQKRPNLEMETADENMAGYNWEKGGAAVACGSALCVRANLLQQKWNLKFALSHSFVFWENHLGNVELKWTRACLYNKTLANTAGKRIN